MLNVSVYMSPNMLTRDDICCKDMLRLYVALYYIFRQHMLVNICCFGVTYMTQSENIYAIFDRSKYVMVNICCVSTLVMRYRILASHTHCGECDFGFYVLTSECSDPHECSDQWPVTCDSLWQRGKDTDHEWQGGFNHVVLLDPHTHTHTHHSDSHSHKRSSSHPTQTPDN